MRLTSEVEAFFGRFAPIQPGDGVVVAFSGGPDSTALLWTLLNVARSLSLRVSAFHVDHGFDSLSAERCAAAALLAHRLGAPFGSVRLEGTALRRPGEGIEEAARRLRYSALEEERLRLGARYVATGHHRDDQAETVALRVLLGSGLEGLAGTLPVRGAVIRPFLAVGRREIAADFLGAKGAGETAILSAGAGGGTLEDADLGTDDELVPLQDPTNRDLRRLRNRLRLALLPKLEEGEPGVSVRLAALAERAGRARRRLELRLEELLVPAPLSSGGVAVVLSRLRELPAPLRSHALAFLHRRAGASYPPGAAARSELERQLGAMGRGARVGCDCGGGWRWEIQGDRFAVRPEAAARPERRIRFTYTVRIPGEIEIPEIPARFKISSGTQRSVPAGEGTFQTDLALPATAGGVLTLRNRLPGDRLRPLGAPGRRRLKEVLIDRRVPREQRDLLPLVCWEGRIAWVPGVAVEHDFRRIDGAEAWSAEMTYL